MVDKFLPEREKSSAPTLPDVPSEAAVHTAYIEKIMPVSTPILEIGIKDEKPSADTEVRLRRDVAMTVLDEMLFSRAGDFYSSLFERAIISPGTSYGYTISESFAYNSFAGEADDPALVLRELNEYLSKLRLSGLSRQDFERAKRVMYAESVRLFDSTESIANTLFSFFCEDADIFEYTDILEEVSFEDVTDAFNRSFAPDTVTLSVIKPL